MDALDRLRRGRCDLPAGRRITRERNHVDVRMADQPLADHPAGARDHIQNACGKDIRRKLAQAQRREWRHGCGLEHDRAARCECRAELPDRHHERVVPRRDLSHDARRLASDHARVRRHVLPGGLALDYPRRAGEETHVVNRELDVEISRSLWFADVLLLEE